MHGLVRLCEVLPHLVVDSEETFLKVIRLGDWLEMLVEEVMVKLRDRETMGRVSMVGGCKLKAEILNPSRCRDVEFT